jgi:hypothetical protein
VCDDRGVLGIVQDGRGARAAAAGALAMIAIATASAEPADAALLGNPDMEYATSDFGSGCGDPGPCLYIQTKLPGADVRAPFKGTITKWRMAQPGSESAGLVVLRKRDNGKFKSIRQSATETTPGPGSYTYETQLKIKRGDYIGVSGESLIGRDNSFGRYSLINPAPPMGGSGELNFAPVEDELLYNATLKR